MTKGLVRYQKCGVFHFLTFSCYRRQPLLAKAGAYKIFERALESVRLRYGFVVAGYVLMPEHVHLLVGEPAVSSLATAVQVLKQQTSRKLKKGWRSSVLAAAILRLQCAQRIEARGKAAIHAPQPGQARSCGEAGRLAMVQLSALRNGEDRHGGDRVGVDCPTKGSEQNTGKGASVNPTLRKVREGWGTLNVVVLREKRRWGKGGPPALQKSLAISRHFVTYWIVIPKIGCGTGQPAVPKGSAGLPMPQPLWNIDSLENLPAIRLEW